MVAQTGLDLVVVSSIHSDLAGKIHAVAERYVLQVSNTQPVYVIGHARTAAAEGHAAEVQQVSLGRTDRARWRYRRSEHYVKLAFAHLLQHVVVVGNVTMPHSEKDWFANKLGFLERRQDTALAGFASFSLFLSIEMQL